MALLSVEDIKEEISYAYVHAVAYQAGCVVDRPNKDRDSIDAVVQYYGRLVPGGIYSPRIDIQLKATVDVELSSRGFSFPLKVKNYNDLREPDVGSPRLLVVLVLPRDRSLWVTHDAEGLITRSCAFWCNLKGFPPTNNTSTCSVFISRENVFSPTVLTSLMMTVALRKEIGT